MIRPYKAILSPESETEIFRMVRLLKYAFIAFNVFAIYTAAPSYKLAMYNGLIAYAQAMREACLRRDGPCGYAGAVWKAVSTELDRIEPSSKSIASDICQLIKLRPECYRALVRAHRLRSDS